MVRLGNPLRGAPGRVGALGLCALLLAACGSQGSPADTATRPTATSSAGRHTVYLYSSLPLSGPERSTSLQIERGIRLALDLAAHRAGRFDVRYRALCDSAGAVKRGHGRPVVLGNGASHRGGSTTATASGPCPTVQAPAAGAARADWTATATVQNAEQAARNPRTVAYIGDLNSGATELSLPILNQAGIVQLTPGSGYPGLTDGYKDVTLPTEPGRYYPQSPRTLLRLIPNDVVQASAALDVLHQSGCRRVAAWEFGGTVEGPALLKAVIATASRYGMAYVRTPAPGPGVKSYNYVRALQQQPGAPRCAVLVGHETAAADVLTTELRLQLTPSPIVVGTSGFCNAGWARGIAAGGISKAVAHNVLEGLYCTTPALPVAAYPGTRDRGGFIDRYRRAFHRAPTTYEYYGYAATELVLEALREVSPRGDSRKQVTRSLVQDYAPNVLSTFTFLDTGDVFSNAYGVDSFVGGRPVWHRTVIPTVRHLLPSAG
ncbi:MAG TPA: ABC transporter substrate-binding protein [Solirubrobacteraceae bacterium]|nr:ABC transporter substrate-binding protein [Solirubrobacteraceae bacterium]